MRTGAETDVFVRYAAQIWSNDERQEFINFIALNPNAGDIIPGTGGYRKVRWTRAGVGKRGGARVIYFLPNVDVVWLLIAYTKTAYDNLPRSFLVALRKEVEDAL